MFKAILIAAALPILSALADPVPDAPAPGDTFNEGTTCHIAWAPDTTGQWKTMNIQLMTGDNFNMVHLTTVATVDGTDATKTTFDYPCPSVTPNSAIYFYQFSSPSSSNLTWTGRFAIADASGKTTPPSESTQPNGGEDIPWGTGALTDPSSATPAPSYLTSGGGSASGSLPGSTAVITTPAATSTTATSAAVSSITNSPTLTTVRTSIPPASVTSTSSTSASPIAASSTASANSASPVLLDFQARGVQALVALVGTAFVFVTMF